MKLLIVTKSLEKGGSERQLYYLVQELIKDKSIDLRIVSLEGGYYDKEYETLGIVPQVFEKSIAQKESLLRKLKPFRLMPKLQRVISDFKPDIVHSTLFHTNIMLKLLLLFHKKTFKLICSYRSPIHFYPGLKFLESINMKSVDITIANSKTGDKDLDTYRVPKHKRHIVYNGFHIAKPNQAKKKQLEQKFTGKDLIITVARIRSEKDYPTNVSTAKEVISKHPHAHFLYVGDGEDIDYIKQLVTANGITQYVSFLGKRDDITELLSISKVFFLPTKIESQSNAILEAMAAKLPIVTTNIDANREILISPLCSVGDHRAMAKQILTILNNEKAPSYIKEHYAFLEQQTITHMVNEYKKIYKQLYRN